MVKVLVSDPIEKEGLSPLLSNSKFDVLIKTGLKPEELLREVSSAEVLLVRSETKVTPTVLESGKNLKLIGRAGVGVDNIDLAAASKQGVIVMNVPGGNTVSAAEHTVSLIMALAHNIAAADESMKQGKWDRKKFMGSELVGKKLGLIGLGRVGREVAQRAIGLEMQVVAHDPMADPEWARLVGVKLTSVENIIAEADFISVHVPLTDATKHMINAETISKMKRGVRLINCARGGVIHEKDLLDALISGHVKGAALDVFESEPPTNWDLVKHPNVIATPHLGASTEEAQTKVSVQLAEAVVEYFEKGIPRNALNLPAGLPPEIKPYSILANRLGRFVGQIVDGPIKKLTGEYGFTQTFFTDVRIPAECLMGKEGEGWKIAMLTLTFERGVTGGQAGGLSRVSPGIDDVLEVARRSRRDGRPALDDPMIRDQLVRFIIEDQGDRLTAKRGEIAALCSERPNAIGFQQRL
jgi:D-3-phosphoglycerate dehydrogenase